MAAEWGSWRCSQPVRKTAPGDRFSPLPHNSANTASQVERSPRGVEHRAGRHNQAKERLYNTAHWAAPLSPPGAPLDSGFPAGDDVAESVGSAPDPVFPLLHHEPPGTHPTKKTNKLNITNHRFIIGSFASDRPTAAATFATCRPGRPKSFRPPSSSHCSLARDNRVAKSFLRLPTGSAHPTPCHRLPIAPRRGPAKRTSLSRHDRISGQLRQDLQERTAHDHTSYSVRAPANRRNSLSHKYFLLGALPQSR